MWENNRLLLGFCVACGVVVSYSLPFYVLGVVIAVCAYLFFFHFKSLGQFGSAVTKNISFTLPAWIKNIITSLMNSYHLSKPLEPEPNSRRDSPYPSNIHIPRRGSSRSGHFTCLDENIDYVNRRNGIGLITPSPSFKNSFSENLRDIRRRSLYSESENSTKIDEISSPHVSPWSRNTSYSNSEYSGVRRVQTVAGPLLGSPGYNKRRSTDYGIFVDASSPGLASRVVQYREEGSPSSNAVWTHQPQYSSPGQFPMVHLSHSPSLPVLSPLNSQKASRRSVRVKIAPPDPLGSRLYQLSSKSNLSSVPEDHSTKSVIETLKEISRKRIHSTLEDSDDDAAKRQKRSGYLDSQSSNAIGDGDSISKRTREESPRLNETSPPIQPAKRIKNNEILSSLSSSRKLLQGGGVKRKSQYVDWSRCSTPVMGKQQKTTENESEKTNARSEISSKISLVAKKLTATDICEKSVSNDIRPSIVRERKNRSLANGSMPGTSPEISSNGSVVSRKASTNGVNTPVDDSPWQKDSPFVSVTSPDDIIDDISALEEKREQDRRSRLMSMMAVINGGESPVKSTPEEKPKSDEKNKPSENAFVSADVLVNSVASSSTEKTLPFGNLKAPGLDSKNNHEANSVQPPAIPVPGFGTSSVPVISTPNNLPKFAPTIPPYTFGASPSTSVGSPPLSVASPVFTRATSSSAPSVDSPKLVSPSLLGSLNQSSQPVLTDSNTKPATEHKSSVTSVLPTSVNSATSLLNTSSNIGTFNFGSQPSNQLEFSSAVPGVTSPVSTSTVPSISTTSPATTSTVPSISTTSPATTNAPTSSLFQIQPLVGLGKASNAPTSVGFNLSASQMGSPSNPVNIFSKPSVGSSDKSTSSGMPNLQNNPTMNLFGNISTSSTPSINPQSSVAVTGSYTFGSPVNPVVTTSASNVQAGMFSFGGASSSPSPQSTQKTSFTSPVGMFGQPSTVSASTSVSNQLVNPVAPSTQKVGGFKFNLHEKPLFSSNGSPASSANAFGGSGISTSNATSPFTLPVSKPAENPFAAAAAGGGGSNITPSQQSQVPSNPFGSSAGKPIGNNPPKEGLFSFGGNNPSSGFSAAPSTGFSAPPATTTSSTASSRFSFPSGGFTSATPTGFPSQSTSSAVGFPVQATSVAPTNSTFSTLSTASSPNFTFGSSPAFGTQQQPQQQQQPPQQQTNPFAFSSTPKTQSQTQQAQPGGMFSFGGATSGVSTGAPSVFGQPAAPVVPAQQPQQSQSQPQAPAQAFQFGSPSNTQQMTGAFSFGAPTNANPPANSGSFQMAGGFGGGNAPAMFSIGSGSTAPRTRSARTRRAK